MLRNPMSSWRPRLEGARLKYLGIVEALEADLRAGRVSPGDRLPAQRAVAEALGVDLTTVTRAFNEARRRGLIDAHPGRGTFIRESGETDSGGRGPMLDLSMNIPPQPPAARLQERIAKEIADLLSHPRGLLHLHYQESCGSEPDRRAGAAWLGRRIDGLHPGRVLVAGGAQAALFALCETLLKPGETIAAGTATYPGLRAAALQKGLLVTPLAMDEGGIIPEDFERVCRDRAPKALYVIPSIDNPTTATLSETRRHALAGLAREHGVAIIEDDPYAPLLPDAPPAIAAIAPDIAWHIATLSKCATPALRVAYVAAPGAAQAQRLAGVLRSTTLMAPPLMAALASRWIAEDRLDEIANAIREENLARQAIAAAVLQGRSFAADPHGHHLWLKLPPPWRAADFAEQADRSGVAIVPGAAFAVGTPPIEAVRVSLGVAPDRGALEDALTLLSGLIAQPPPDMRAIV